MTPQHCPVCHEPWSQSNLAAHLWIRYSRLDVMIAAVVNLVEINQLLVDQVVELDGRRPAPVSQGELSAAAVENQEVPSDIPSDLFPELKKHLVWERMRMTEQIDDLQYRVSTEPEEAYEEGYDRGYTEGESDAEG